MPVGGGGAIATSPFHYDDLIMHITDIPVSIWTYSADNSTDITTLDRIGIKTSDVSTRMKFDGTLDKDGGLEQYDYNIMLDVGGSGPNGGVMGVSGTSVTTEICDLSGSNCYPPDALGGVGYITCAHDGTTAMVGIQSGAANCEIALPTTVIKNKCATGHYVTGIVKGVVQCSP
jgi:hypothetical protein